MKKLNSPFLSINLWSQWNVEIPKKKTWFRASGVLTRWTGEGMISIIANPIWLCLEMGYTSCIAHQMTIFHRVDGDQPVPGRSIWIHLAASHPLLWQGTLTAQSSWDLDVLLGRLCHSLSNVVWDTEMKWKLASYFSLLRGCRWKNRR